MEKGVLSARAYHWGTSHGRNQITPHYLDFDKYPLPFKSYEFLGKTYLSTDFQKHDLGFLELLSKRQEQASMNLKILSHILFLSYGVTFRKDTGSIPFLLRTVPSAGGLYPCHIYVGINHLDGLETGVYYFDPIQGCVGRIRDQTKCHSENSGMDEKHFLSGKPRIFFMVTAFFYNSAWKYRQRAFRYMLLDSGHLIENLGLALNLYGVNHSILYDFTDDDVSKLLGLDPTLEVPLVCVSVPIGKSVSEPDDESKGRVQEDKEKIANSLLGLSTPVRYEILEQIHASGIPIVPERPLSAPKITGKTGIKTVVLSLETGQKKTAQKVQSPSFEDSVIHRRSRRNFTHEKIHTHDWSALFTRVFCNLFSGPYFFEPDFFDPVFFDKGTENQQSLDKNTLDQAARAKTNLTLGMICQNLQGLDDGFHIFSQDFSQLELMTEGRLAPKLANVCLNQEWIRAAGINFLFMANLVELEKIFGPRGYRYIMFNAGRIAQRIYLAAQDLGFGCCGIGAFYDEEAKILLDLNEDAALLYGVAAGPVKKMVG
jgi:SagB-type dehydrogenase family enzyme